MNLKKSEDGYIGGFGGRKRGKLCNYIITSKKKG